MLVVYSTVDSSKRLVMQRLLLLIFVGSLVARLLGGVQVIAQAPQRSLLYNPDVPIADRLLPTDKQVLIYKAQLPGFRVDEGNPESFDQEIRRLQRAEIIAVVQISSANGELTADGTWIRSRLTARIHQLVQANSTTQIGGSLEFGFPNGTAAIGQVVVTAGTFRQFVEGQRYLVFLVIDPGIRGYSPALAFLLNPQGNLERVKNSDGSEQRFRTNLIGRNVSDVVESLRAK
jgi:hypothetical protein